MNGNDDKALALNKATDTKGDDAVNDTTNNTNKTDNLDSKTNTDSTKGTDNNTDSKDATIEALKNELKEFALKDAIGELDGFKKEQIPFIMKLLDKNTLFNDDCTINSKELTNQIDSLVKAFPILKSDDDKADEDTAKIKVGADPSTASDEDTPEKGSLADELVKAYQNKN